MGFDQMAQVDIDLGLIDLSRCAVRITAIDRKDSSAGSTSGRPGAPMNLGDFCTGISAELCERCWLVRRGSAIISENFGG